ncbi:MAG: hypothetical protein IJX20_04490, partial [Alphaproteobacteria bacterium]|nr:hypothetical protein [Alphaproteobacteria bacterium]
MKLYKICVLFVVVLLSSCKVNPQPVIVMPNNQITAQIDEPQQLSIKTSEGARVLDLEAPLRCSVNWS